MNATVLVIGNLTRDEILTIEGPLERGGKWDVLDRKVRFGGQAANVACTLAGLGIAAQLVAACGDDGMSEEAIDDLERAGVDTGAVARRAGAGLHRAVIVHEAGSGERTILMRRPPGCEVGVAHLERVWPGKVGFVYLDGHEAAACARACALARAGDAALVLDVERSDAPFAEIVRQAGHVLGSRGAILRLGASSSVFAALARVAPEARLACATHGAEAIAYIHDGERGSMATVATRPVDSTGAGDAFRGAYVAALVKGLAPVRALAFAAGAGAAKCRFPGPRLPPAALGRLRRALEALAADPSA